MLILTTKIISISGPSMVVQLLLISLPPSSIGLFYLPDGTLIPPPPSPSSAPSLSPAPSPTLLPSPLYTIPRDLDGKYKLRFRPTSNSYSISTYCTFSYTAYDGVSGLYALDRGIVSIFVTHVDKPPVPTHGLHIAVTQVLLFYNLNHTYLYVYLHAFQIHNSRV